MDKIIKKVGNFFSFFHKKFHKMVY